MDNVQTITDSADTVIESGSLSGVNAVFDYLANVAVTTFSHLVWLLGVIFVFGLLLYFCARFTRNTYVKSIGLKFDVYVTGWIGTPVHELGHALFCVLFRHRIAAIKLFDPDPTTGMLGYVEHYYNPKSIYQRIGHFFIGIGPILFGAVVLYALMYFLMPEMTSLFSQVEQQSAGFARDISAGSWGSLWGNFYASLTGISGGLFDAGNLANWRFWIFAYLSLCIAAHMELSPSDIRGALSGLITFVITIFVLNAAIIGIETLGAESFAGEYWKYIKLETYALHINAALGALGALFTYALIISWLNFALSYACLSVYNIVKYRKPINPFWC